ncbi:2112_t:CDS:1, partial [Racocetra persica]
NSIKRCTPGGKKGDCGLMEKCTSNADCKLPVTCVEKLCRFPPA